MLEGVPASHVPIKKSTENTRQLITKLDENARSNNLPATLLFMSVIPGLPSQIGGWFRDAHISAWTDPEAAKGAKAGLELGHQTKCKYNEEVKMGKQVESLKCLQSIYGMELWHTASRQPWRLHPKVSLHP